MELIIDTPDDTSGRLTQIKAAGVRTILRYVNISHSWKTVSVSEAKAISNAGMRLGLIFETDGKPYGTSEGQRDGHAAYLGAKQVGAPGSDTPNCPGRAVLYYCVDYDPGPSEIGGIIAAFTAFRRECGPYYRVGAYCSGYCAEKLVDAKRVDYTDDGKLPLIWITQSLGFRGTRNWLKSGQWVIFQKMPTHLAGLDIDPDTSIHASANDDIGDFVPFQPIVDPVKPAPEVA